MILKMISFLVLLLSPLMAVAAVLGAPFPDDSWSVISENGEIATLVTIIGTFFGVLYHLVDKMGRGSEKLDNVVKNVDNLRTDVNNLGTEVAAVKTDVKHLRS